MQLIHREMIWNSHMNIIYNFRSVKIVSQRSLQALLHVDFIWRFTSAAKRLTEFNRLGRKIFDQVLLIHF